MKKAILISIAAAVSLAAAAPALAQPYNYNQGAYDQSRPYGGISHRVDYLNNRINQEQQDRTISWREANRLRSEVNQVRWTEQRDLSQGGLNDWQRSHLNQTLDNVAAQLGN